MGFWDTVKKAGEVSKQIAKKDIDSTKRASQKIRRRNKRTRKKCPDNKLIAQEAQRRGIY